MCGASTESANETGEWPPVPPEKAAAHAQSRLHCSDYATGVEVETVARRWTRDSVLIPTGGGEHMSLDAIVHCRTKKEA